MVRLEKGFLLNIRLFVTLGTRGKTRSNRNIHIKTDKLQFERVLSLIPRVNLG